MLNKYACGHLQQQCLSVTCVMCTRRRRDLCLQTRAHNSQPVIGKGARRAAVGAAAAGPRSAPLRGPRTLRSRAKRSQGRELSGAACARNRRARRSERSVAQVRGPDVSGRGQGSSCWGLPRRQNCWGLPHQSLSCWGLPRSQRCWGLPQQYCKTTIG